MTLYKLLSICFILILCNANPNYYKGYKLFEVWSNTSGKDQLFKFVQNDGYDVHSFAKSIDRPVHIMAKPEKISELETFLKQNKYDWTLKQDVEKVIAKEMAKNSYFKKKNDNIDIHSSFLQYEDIMQYMQKQHKKYSGKTQLIHIGNTVGQRPIMGLRVSKLNRQNRANMQRPIIFIDGLIHAREWMAGAMVLHLMTEIVTNQKYNDLLYADWIFIPVLNPDGYMYSFEHRMWRKNRQKLRPNLTGPCIGTDLNRNFGFHWMESGSSSKPCEIIYAGSKAFSEHESQHFKEFVEKINENKDIILYISFHCYGAMLLYPYSYQNKLPPNYALFDKLAKGFKKKIFQYSGTSYVEGPSATTIYESAGSSDDWMYGVAGVPLSFTIELPGDSFEADPSTIKRTVEETMIGINYLAKTVIDMVKKNESLI